MAAATAALLLAGCGDRGAASGAEKAEAQARDEAESLAPVGTLPQGVAAAQGTEGRVLYLRTCVMCHGEQGQGTLLGPALTDTARTGGFEQILAVVRDGVAQPDGFPVPMTPLGDGTLTDPQVRAVAAYAYSIARR